MADDPQRRAVTPTRKQRLERSIRPSSARFTSPPKMRDRFDTWNSSRKPIRHQPRVLDLSPSSDESRYSSKEHVTTPHVGEEIVFTTSASMSSGKDEFRQDSEHSGSSHRSLKMKARKAKRDGVVTTDSEDDSAEIGFEVSVKDIAAAAANCNLSESSSPQQEQEGGRDRGESSSGRSSIVFNFSGISKTKSTELTVSKGPSAELSSTRDPSDGEAFSALFAEIEKLVGQLVQTTVRTPKVANRAGDGTQLQNAFHQYYFSAKTLTSVYSSGEELSFGMHAEIMKLVGALGAESTTEQMHGTVQDLYKMGIRVLGNQPARIIKETNHDNTTPSPSLDRMGSDEVDPDKNGSFPSKTMHTDDNESSGRRDSRSCSSNEIDKRWEEYRTRYIDPRTPNSSDEVDDRWERFRERALTSDLEKKDSGTLSLTSDMEDDLIRDCIESGLPSPHMTRTWSGPYIPSKLQREDSARDDKLSLRAPTAHIQSIHSRKMRVERVQSEDKSQEHASPDSQLKRGQPDVEHDQQPELVKRVTTWEEPWDSERQSRLNVEEADPILFIGEHLSSEEIESSPTNNEEDRSVGDSASGGPNGITKADDETISSLLSGEGAVNHFKSLSTSGREASRFERSQGNAILEDDEMANSSQSETTHTHKTEKESDHAERSCNDEDQEALEFATKQLSQPVPAMETPQKIQARSLEIFQSVLSTATGSCSVSSRSSSGKPKTTQDSNDKSSKKQIQIPKNFHSEDENESCPRIEISLLPSQATKAITREENSAKEDSAGEQVLEASDAQTRNDDSIQGSGLVANREEQGASEYIAEDKLFYEVLDEMEPKVTDAFRDETDILEISSSLTGGTRIEEGIPQKGGAAARTMLDSETQDKGYPLDLSVSSTKGKSFDSKSNSSSSGVPAWRLDPIESLSDVILEILIDGNEEAKRYHLHRHMLAIGPRRSDFLADMFRKDSGYLLRLPLDRKASNFLPILFDYVYCSDYDIDVTTENAMPLRQLAKTLQVVPLVVKVAGFILEDLSPGTMSTYVSECVHFGDRQVTELIVSRCSQTLQTIGVADPLWAVMEPEFFLRVLSSPLIDRHSLSPHLSILVKEFVTLHQYEIDLVMFSSLTSEEIMPVVDREAALPLIELCEPYESVQCEPLQKRCAHTMACYWKTTPHEDRHRLFALLRNLSSSFTVDFLEIVETGRSQEMTPPRIKDTNEQEISERQIAERFSFSIGDLCDELAGDDGYSVSGMDDILLSWRLDAMESFSDWTIKVIHQDLDQIDLYHVHKQILSLGQYRSEFFAQVFHAEGIDGDGRRVTAIQLDHEAAVLFPEVLDFIYTPAHSLVLTCKNATVLRFLARVLGISLLSKQVLEFISEDISLDNVTSYLKDAYAFHDERILWVASKLCATQIRHIDMDSPLLEEIKPDFFARVAASSDIKDSSKCHLTILITKYFSLHNLDEEILAELLKHVEVPRIDYLSALKLLKILNEFERSQEIDMFDQLQRRCANILTENWNDIRDNYREEVFGLFPLLHPSLLTEILDVIDRQYMVQHYESMSLQSRLVKRYRAQVAEANHLREQEVFSLQKELEERTIKMLEIQQSLEDKLDHVNASLNRRTGRSSASYGMSSPTRRRMESGIPRLHTESSSTVAAERIRAAREAARKELNSATTCCPYSSQEVEGRDDTPQAGPADNSQNGRFAEQIETEKSFSTRSSVTAHSGAIFRQEEEGETVVASSRQKETSAKQSSTHSAAAGSYETAYDDGEDAELSA